MFCRLKGKKAEMSSNCQNFFLNYKSNCELHEVNIYDYV